MKTKVSLRQCSSYNKEEVSLAIKALLEPLGNMSSFVKKNDKV